MNKTIVTNLSKTVLYTTLSLVFTVSCSESTRALNRAWALYRLGQMAEARTVLNKHLVDLSGNADALWLLGKIQLHSKDYQQALSSLEQADPEEISKGTEEEFLGDLGRAYAAMKKWEKALEPLKQGAKNADPTNELHADLVAAFINSCLSTGKYNLIRNYITSRNWRERSAVLALKRQMDLLEISKDGNSPYVTSINFDLKKTPEDKYDIVDERLEEYGEAVTIILSLKPNTAEFGLQELSKPNKFSAVSIAKTFYDKQQKQVVQTGWFEMPFGADTKMLVSSHFARKKTFLRFKGERGSKTAKIRGADFVVLADGLGDLSWLRDIVQEGESGMALFIGKLVGYETDSFGDELIRLAKNLPVFYALAVYGCPHRGPCCKITKGDNTESFLKRCSD